MLKYHAHDTETTLIGKDNIIPDLICSSFAELGKDGYEVAHWSPKDAHIKRVKELLQDPEAHLIYHNSAFDLAVLAKYDWDLLPLIWEAASAGRIHDTLFREQLINLTTSGSIDIIEQHGLKTQVRYSLGELVKSYLQIDITAEKEAEDSVRTNFEAVMYKPLEEWPKEFIEYAGKDAEYTGLIFLEQEKRREEVINDTGYDPFVKESHLVLTALSLQFMTAQGAKLDKEKVKEVTKEFIDMYNDPRLVEPLVEHGIVIPAKEPEPYANGAKAHVEGCKDKKNCDCPVKMKAGQPEKGSTTALHEYVWKAARKNPNLNIWLSDSIKEKLKENSLECPHPLPRDFIEENESVPSVQFEGDKKPTKFKLQVNKEWLATYAGLDPILALYDERHKIQKIVTSYLPCLYWADGYKTGCPIVLDGETDKFAGKEPSDRVHGQYASLKETGRTSSYAAKRGKGRNEVVTFPSWNVQQVDPRIRNCVVPEKGNVLFSIDYSAMELCTAAQVAYNLLGYEGVLMGLINEGKDTHSYLGAQIACALDVEFTKAWGLDSSDPAKSYELFKAVAKCKDECDSPVFRKVFEETYVGKKWGDHIVTMDDCTMAAYYKHFRTFGKPTGLGFWGGLGEPTFASMARATYGIAVDVETAKLLRQIWRTYIPEGQQYLDYVNKCMVDPLAAPEVVEDDHGKKRKRSFFCYDTPMGMHRAKCTYTAAANGCALQSPSAEGATSAVIEVMKSCTVGELAGYVFPWGFIHDEICGEIVLDGQTTHRIEIMQDIMKSCMERITPDVRASTEAALMYRWSKFADPVYEGNKLVPWVPEEEK